MSFSGAAPGATEVRLPKVTKVKNKAPSARQITAEQILREAKEIQLEDDYKAPKTIITDPEELQEYRLKKRKEFEDTLRRVGRWHPAVFVKYATWEEGQKDFRRARSVWERALEGDGLRNVTFWVKYAEMEMRHRFVNHARNVWDRAVTYLPRQDQLWYKYVHMEEMLGNTAGARSVFDRWMKWEPDHQAWMAYIRFEQRYNEVERARAIFERYVEVLPSVKSWVRYAKFEMGHSQVALARQCYERALEALGEDAHTEDFFIKFAEFEEMAKEVERARAIFKYGLDHLPKAAAQALYARFVAFEKQHGDREGIEDVVLSKRRFTYEQEVTKDPLNYDAWFDYIKLEESAGNPERIREVYERAVANLPPAAEKRYWQRYIFLWVKYALWEEVDAREPERAREVYRTCLKLIPHSSFTFAKIWLLAAKLEIRQHRLEAARKILGMALGLCPKNKLFKEYIEIEALLGKFDRCRTLYEKHLEFAPYSAAAWQRFAEFEAGLQEMDRVRALYELAVSQPVLDMPELLWKGYIDFEISQGERERTRVLYERLLDRTKHVKVWLSYAKFEAEPLPGASKGQEEEEEGGAGPSGRGAEEGPESPAARAAAARAVYERAFRSIRESQPDAKEEAVMLLEAWRDFEANCGAGAPAERERAVAAVSKKMPKRIKRKRPLVAEDGSEVGMEEYYDYVFPDEAAAAPNLKLLEAAYRWKRQKRQAADGEGGAE